MHSFTTTLCAILTDLRAAIARIAARDRAPFLDFFWPRISHTAHLFELFEHLLAEWRNGTLPDASARHQSPAATPSARRKPTLVRLPKPADVPAPQLPPNAAPAPRRRQRPASRWMPSPPPAPHPIEKPA